MNTLDITASGASLAEAVRAMGDNPLALIEGGRPVAVLLPVGGCDLESISLSLNPKFLKMLQESDRSYYKEGGIPHEEMMRQLAEMPPPGKNGAAPARRKPKSKRV